LKLGTINICRDIECGQEPGEHTRCSDLPVRYIANTTMSGARESSRVCGSCSKNLLKAALGALAMTASGAAAVAAGGAPLNMGVACAATRPASTATAPPAAVSSNRWVSKALAARGGADEPAETPGGIPGVMSEVEIALSSFNDIVGENLVVVDNAKKGTTKEVRTEGERAR